MISYNHSLTRWTLLVLLLSYLSPATFAAEKEIKQIKDRLEKVESELAVIKAQSTLIIQKTVPSFLNRYYSKVGFSILMPRRSKFPFSTDTGLGAHLGVGRYFGNRHVVELSLDWDLYVSSTLRYRFEFHSKQPMIIAAPVIGVKQRIFDTSPWDDFIETPSGVKRTFFLTGFYVGMPFGQSLFSTEMNFLMNEQFVITATAQMQFFF